MNKPAHYIIGIPASNMNAFEDYLDKYKIEYVRSFEGVIVDGDALYYTLMDSKQELSIKLSFDITGCIKVSDNRLDKEDINA